MKCTILYDNTVSRPDLVADWGFACIVEAHGKTILFDTGASGSILLKNMNTLGIDPLVVDEIFISHGHFDHVGGLSAFLRKNNTATIIAPSSIIEDNRAENIISVNSAMKLHDHIFTTGELDYIEQSLVIETKKGLVIIAGCSHPSMEDILSQASRFGTVYAVIGGLHGFSEFELFKDLGAICPAHCTMYKDALKSRYPEKCIEGGAGTVIEI